MIFLPLFAAVANFKYGSTTFDPCFFDGINDLNICIFDPYNPLTTLTVEANFQTDKSTVIKIFPSDTPTIDSNYLNPFRAEAVAAVTIVQFDFNGQGFTSVEPFVFRDFDDLHTISFICENVVPIEHNAFAFVPSLKAISLSALGTNPGFVEAQRLADFTLNLNGYNAVQGSSSCGCNYLTCATAELPQCTLRERFQIEHSGLQWGRNAETDILFSQNFDAVDACDSASPKTPFCADTTKICYSAQSEDRTECTRTPFTFYDPFEAPWALFKETTIDEIKGLYVLQPNTGMTASNAAQLSVNGYDCCTS